MGITDRSAMKKYVPLVLLAVVIGAWIAFILFVAP
jgi:hypothetical protein